jgi:site-specific recombinase XerD
MTYAAKYEGMLHDPDVKRWFDNLKAKSILTATVYLRTLGYFCELTGGTPQEIIQDAKERPIEFRNNFSDFIRDLEQKGKAGSYLARFKRVLRSWTRFHSIDVKLDINIAGENESPTLINERVPSREELGKILRKASPRGRVSISMMAFTGLRPESMGNYEGTDGLRLGDIKDLKMIDSVEFNQIPATVVVRNRLSKASNQYFSFIPEEGVTYIREYLEERTKAGEILTAESPLLQFDARGMRTNDYLKTALVTRDIRDAIRRAGLKMRPYVLRAYFATAMDIAESKGLISHPWRQFMMGHKGDIEARYSTNKGRLPPEMINEMRESYRKCTKYLETRITEPSEDEAKTYLQQQLLLAVGYKQTEIDKMEFADMDNEAFQKLLRDKVTGTMTGNGNRQRLVDIDEIGSYLEKGYEFQASLPNGKAVMKLPF